jgi:hypothetical protein
MATRIRKSMIDRAIAELRSMCVSGWSREGEDDEYVLCLLVIGKTVSAGGMARLL